MMSAPRRKAPRRDEPPYTRYALFNPYNLSLFVGLVVLGLTTEHHWIIVLACAAEALWLVFAPDSTLLRRVWFDPAFTRAERAFAEERCRAKVAMLLAPDRARLGYLVGEQQRIERLA